MKFSGRIYKVFPVQSGKSKSGNDWTKQEFVFEYFENPTDRYADRVMLSLMNEQIEKYAVKELEEVTIGFGHSVREYNGRWFNEVRMYSMEKKTQQAAPAPTAETKAETAAESTAEKAEGEGDLPF